MGLKPADFWSLSLPEWRALCAVRFPAARAPLDRGGLDRLMALYPDVPHG